MKTGGKGIVEQVFPTTWPDVVMTLGKAAIQLCGIGVILGMNASNFDETELKALCEVGILALGGNKLLDSFFLQS